MTTMKFTYILLISTVLSQEAILHSFAHPEQSINPQPGTCTPLKELDIYGATTTPEIGLKFYSEPECTGYVIATVTGNNFKFTKDPSLIRSVKTVYRKELNSGISNFFQNIFKGIPRISR
jgi:hypothetical protein